MNSSRSDVVVSTPWGRSDTLRSRRLRPGPGHSRDGVAHSQQERLFGATVAAVAQHGYEATRVADILRIAGVSRSAFYRYFANKQECFVATLDALAEIFIGVVADRYDASASNDEQLEAVLAGLVEIIVAHPAAIQLWMIEIYAAGPEAVDRIESFTDVLENLIIAAIDQAPDRAGMPREGVRPVLGSLRQMIHSRLRQGRQAELPAEVPEMISWALSYRPPPEPLHVVEAPPWVPVASQDPDQLRRRVLAAVTETVAEKGYQATTISDIAQRAGISLSTFYAYYESKHEAFLAAVDDGHRQLLEVTAPAIRLAPNRLDGIRDGVHALLAFCAANPALATVCGQSVFAGGREGFDLHEQATCQLQSLLEERSDGASPIVCEAIASSITAMIYQQIRRGGVARLYSLAATGSYLTLAPLCDPRTAARVAGEEWRPAAVSGGPQPAASSVSA